MTEAILVGLAAWCWYAGQHQPAYRWLAGALGAIAAGMFIVQDPGDRVFSLTLAGGLVALAWRDHLRPLRWRARAGLALVAFHLAVAADVAHDPGAAKRAFLRGWEQAAHPARPSATGTVAP